jgi:hypothetical protein
LESLVERALVEGDARAVGIATELERQVWPELQAARARLRKVTAHAAVILSDSAPLVLRDLEQEAAKCHEDGGLAASLVAYLDGRRAALDRSYEMLVVAARQDLGPSNTAVATNELPSTGLAAWRSSTPSGPQAGRGRPA